MTAAAVAPQSPAGAPRSRRSLIEQAVARKDVRALCRALFGVQRLFPGQVRIVRAIAFRENRRIIINAHTQYGKTWAVALGICLLVLLDARPLKIRLIGPTKEQASILRNYIADFIQACAPLQELLDLDATGIRRLKKEVSKKRFTFRDGKEILVLTAEGNAKRILGFGGDVIVLDESVLLQPDAWAKISRMFVGRPDGMLVEMSNPWHADNHYHKHWVNKKYLRIHVGWRQSLREGRLTMAEVEFQRGELTPTEFQVLMESRFPDAAKDQLIPWSWIKRAQTMPRPVEVHSWTTWYGLDVAAGGLDKTVLTHLEVGELLGDRGQFFDVKAQWENGFADTEDTADWAAALMEEGATVRVDATGVGKGVGDKLRRRGFRVVEVMVGAGARKKKRFANQKAELFWDARRSFERKQVRLPRNAKKLAREFSIYRYKVQSGRLVVYEEPTFAGGSGMKKGKSPDHADSCAYGMHGRGRKKLGVG